MVMCLAIVASFPCLSLCLIHNANVYDWQCVNIFEWR